ncbi:MAG: aldehyde ferredoxin oxidoreductase C-terminal domain-containing protein [Acidobacteriota bacterium]
MGRFGYHGRILEVDLTTGEWRVEEPAEAFWRIHGGGGLLATGLLLRGTRAGLDSFDGENLLIFASSVVAGHGYPGLARYTVAAKSPLTGGIGETRGEGPFGLALKGSGYDAIVLRGRARELSALRIDAEEGGVWVERAAGWAGMRVTDCLELVRARYGEGSMAAVIGPAGEKRVRFASIVTGGGHQAPRIGLGAVMGAKNLKAVVICGRKMPAVAEEGVCRELALRYGEEMGRNPLTRWQKEPPGFAAWLHTHGIDTALCVNNYRESVFRQAGAYRPEVFLGYAGGASACPGCPNDCIQRFVPGGYVGKAEAGAMHQEITGALGANCGIGELEAVVRANVLVNELGMDATSLGFTISMAMEWGEEGLLSGGPRFGDSAGMLRLIEEVGMRSSVLGDLLAEGSRRAARRQGGGAERFAMEVKGLEMVPFEPRTQTNLALGYAVAPVGPRYDICEHDWDFDTEAGWPHAIEQARTLGIFERIPMQELSLRKVRNYKALATVWSAADALDFCIFAVAPTRVFTLEQMAEMLGAVTGWMTSAYEVMRFGERRLHLMRVYNLREGLRAEDDGLPERFFADPVREGRWAGTRLDRGAFAAAIGTYYRMMGWDERGVPLGETLLDHHLEGYGRG